VRARLCFVVACQVAGCSSLAHPVDAPTTGPRGRDQDTSQVAPAPSPSSAATASVASNAAVADVPSSSTPPVSRGDFATLVHEQPIPCEDAPIGLSIPKQSSSLRCADGFRRCEGEIPVTIENCTGVELTVESLHLWANDVVGERAVGGSTSKPWPPIPPGMRVTRSVAVKWGATYEARLQAKSTKASYRLSSREGKLLNTAYLAAEAACKACHGNWGPQGILQLEGCTCRARDGGKPCYDADDCEGECEYDHIQKLGNGLGRNVGKCTALVSDFGCITYIPQGDSKKSPRPLAELGPSARVCRD
jgi:hypothetical protein